MAAQLIFIPVPGAGHLTSAVEIAKLLVSRDERISITILVIKGPTNKAAAAANTTKSLQKSADHNRISYVDLPMDESVTNLIKSSKSTLRLTWLKILIESQRNPVRNAVEKIVSGFDECSKLAGFVIDMFCTPMIDVANEFGVPSYVFFTSGAAYLSLHFYHMSLDDQERLDIIQRKDSGKEVYVSCFVNPVPVKVFPQTVLSEEGSALFLSITQGFKQANAILVNTFEELEAYAIKSLVDDPQVPRVYNVGPVLNLERKDKNSEDDVVGWLNNQPPSSVVFLCFGSMGTFNEEQVGEIANGLERSGQRFLWSLRRAAQPTDTFGMPKEYENLDQVLPEGFMARTIEIGKVIGWAPQVAILSHPAVGGFVSHCGWNSTLESIWFGVPMATWPIYAEQQLNAFELVKELGVAADIKMEYQNDLTNPVELVVTADEIEKGIRCVMNGESEMRKNVQQMKVQSRMAVAQGGSSYVSLGHFIQQVMDNVEGMRTNDHIN